MLGQRFGKLCGLFKIKTKTLTWVYFCSIHRRGGWYGWFLGFLGHSKEGQNLGHTYIQLHGPGWTEDGRCFPKDTIY